MLDVHIHVRFTYKQTQFKPLKVAFAAYKMLPKENLWVESYINTHITASEVL